MEEFCCLKKMNQVNIHDQNFTIIEGLFCFDSEHLHLKANNDDNISLSRFYYSLIGWAAYRNYELKKLVSSECVAELSSHLIFFER